MRGRKPKPTKLKLVAGNPGKRKINRREPKPRREIPSPPAHVSDAARLAWGAMSVKLDRLGLLTELDAIALEELCETYCEVIDLRADVGAHGRIQVVTSQMGDKVEKARPAVAQLADAAKRLKGIMAEFGLTPSSRSRIELPEPDGNSDPAEAYFA